MAIILKEDDIENQQLVNIHQFDNSPKYDKNHHDFIYSLDIKKKLKMSFVFKIFE